MRKIGIDVPATAPVAAEMPPGEGVGERAGRAVSGATVPVGLALADRFAGVGPTLGAAGVTVPAAGVVAVAAVDVRPCGAAVRAEALAIATVAGQPALDTGAAGETGAASCCDATGERSSSPVLAGAIGGSRAVGCGCSGRICGANMKIGSVGSAGSADNAGSAGIAGSIGTSTSVGSEGSVSDDCCSDASSDAITTGVEPVSRAAVSSTFPIARDASPSTVGVSGS